MTVISHYLLLLSMQAPEYQIDVIWKTKAGQGVKICFLILIHLNLILISKQLVCGDLNVFSTAGEGKYFLWRRRKTEKEKEENFWRSKLIFLRRRRKRRGRTYLEKEIIWRWTIYFLPRRIFCKSCIFVIPVDPVIPVTFVTFRPSPQNQIWSPARRFWVRLVPPKSP